MYFFDLEDYVAAKVIGCDNEDLRTNGDWEDMASTAIPASDAFLKAFDGWYTATRVGLPALDCAAFDAYYTDITTYTTDPRYDAFWNIATNAQIGTLTRAIWDDYLALMSETMCKVQELMRYLDGDTFEAFTP